MLLPLSYDANGNVQYKFELASSSGTRTIDIGKSIDRYDAQIFRTILADFVLLGSGSTAGSYSMHSDKSAIFLMTLGIYLSTITETLNRVALPRLMRLNGFALKGYPQIDHTPLEQVDIAQLTTALQALAASGAPLWPNEDAMRRIFEIMGLPAAVEAKGTTPKTAVDDASEVPDEIYPGDTLDENGKVVPHPDRQVTKPGERPGPKGVVDRDAAAAKPRPKPFNRIA